MAHATSRKVWIALTAGAALIVVALLGASLAGNDARAGTPVHPAANRAASAAHSLMSCGTWSEQGSAAATAVIPSPFCSMGRVATTHDSIRV